MNITVSKNPHYVNKYLFELIFTITTGDGHISFHRNIAISPDDEKLNELIAFLNFMERKGDGEYKHFDSWWKFVSIKMNENYPSHLVGFGLDRAIRGRISWPTYPTFGDGQNVTLVEKILWKYDENGVRYRCYIDMEEEVDEEDYDDGDDYEGDDEDFIDEEDED